LLLKKVDTHHHKDTSQLEANEILRREKILGNLDKSEVKRMFNSIQDSGFDIVADFEEFQ